MTVGVGAMAEVIGTLAGGLWAFIFVGMLTIPVILFAVVGGRLWGMTPGQKRKAAEAAAARERTRKRALHRYR